MEPAISNASKIKIVYTSSINGKKYNKTVTDESKQPNKNMYLPAFSFTSHQAASFSIVWGSRIPYQLLILIFRFINGIDKSIKINPVAKNVIKLVIIF